MAYTKSKFDRWSRFFFGLSISYSDGTRPTVSDPCGQGQRVIMTCIGLGFWRADITIMLPVIDMAKIKGSFGPA